MFEITIGKAVSSISKKIKGGSSALPGKLAKNINKNYLKNIKIDDCFIIFVTGTNGKTSTTNYIYRMLLKKKLKEKLVCNTKGSNMLQGIGTTLIDACKKFENSYAIQNKIIILEVDELTVPRIMEDGIIPNLLVCTNLSKDQEDRTTSPKHVAHVIQKACAYHNVPIVVRKEYEYLFDIPLSNCTFWNYKKDHDAIFLNMDANDEELEPKELAKGIDYPDDCPSYILDNFMCAAWVFLYLQNRYLVEESKRIPSIDLSVYGRAERISIKDPFSNEYITLGLDLCKNEAGLDAVMKDLKPKRPFMMLANLGRTPADGNDLSWFFKYDFSKIFDNELFKGFYVFGDIPDELVGKNENINIEKYDITFFEKNNYDIFYISNYSKLNETKKALETRQKWLQ